MAHDKTAEVGERARPKELVKIYSIVRSHRPDISESETWQLSEVIHEESLKRQLDPLLVLALIQVESSFQSAAVSPMGARGMMQIMPDTGRFLAETLAGEYGIRFAAFKPESLDDPVLNLRLGIYYLHDLRKQFQHLNHALTAYNFGPRTRKIALKTTSIFQAHSPHWCWTPTSATKNPSIRYFDPPVTSPLSRKERCRRRSTPRLLSPDLRVIEIKWKNCRHLRSID